MPTTTLTTERCNKASAVVVCPPANSFNSHMHGLYNFEQGGKVLKRSVSAVCSLALVLKPFRHHLRRFQSVRPDRGRKIITASEMNWQGAPWQRNLMCTEYRDLQGCKCHNTIEVQGQCDRLLTYLLTYLALV